ncbi:MAG: hypothetical protein ACJAT2_000753 [Bacteriovoracaceae bacterium]|jgi:hypothetical protein
MRVYSSTLNAFCTRLKAEVKTILIKEMGIEVKRSRFLFNGYLYPFSIITFESPKQLGYFNGENYQIGINKNLVYLAKPEVLKNILRHELAHLYIFLTKGPDEQAHGSSFREVCKKFGWGPEVSSAYADIKEENKLSSAPEFEKILSRIEKLLSLAKSANQHEATAATAKANELLMKYNLELYKKDPTEAEEEVYVKNIYEAKRTNVQMNALYEILIHFYIQPVLNRTTKKVYLEAIGSRVNVEMADYLAKFFVAEFERLYKDSGLKGVSAKNSFIKGIAEGFSSKIIAQKKSDPGLSKELVKLENVLKSQVRMVYSRMGSSASSTKKVDEKARALGLKAGKDLKIKKGINQAKKPRLLGFFK